MPFCRGAQNRRSPPEKLRRLRADFFCVSRFGADIFLDGGGVQIGKAAPVLPLPSKKPAYFAGRGFVLHQAFVAGTDCPAQIARSRVIGGAAGENLRGGF